MARRIKKQHIDSQLLEAIFTVELEWKQIKKIIEKSIEPTMDAKYSEMIAEKRYLFLLKEARRRKVSAIRYSK